MQWDKRKRGGLVAVVSLLIVALIAAVVWDRGVSAEDTFFDFSALGSALGSAFKSLTQTKPIIEFTRQTVDGLAYEYRTNTDVETGIPDGYKRSRVIGYMYANEADRRIAVYERGSQYSRDIRKFYGRGLYYRRTLGIAGYIEKDRTDRNVPLIQFSKWLPNVKQEDYIYVTNNKDYSQRHYHYWENEYIGGYVLRPPKTRPLIRYRLNNAYEYRAYGETVPNYEKGPVLGYLMNDGNDGLIALKEFSKESDMNDRYFTVDDQAPEPYTHYIGVAGYCSENRSGDMDTALIHAGTSRAEISRLFTTKNPERVIPYLQSRKLNAKLVCFFKKDA